MGGRGARLTGISVIRCPLLVAALVVALLAVGGETALAGEVVYVAPGTGAPPSTIGPYEVQSFPADGQPIQQTVESAPAPSGAVGFTPGVEHLRVNEGWGTWSNGYDGDVYYSAGTVMLTLPAHTHAFYLYGQPEEFGTYQITAEASEGTSSGPVSVSGLGGARYFGFYATGGATLSTITVSSSDLSGFAIGEFGIAQSAVTISCGTADTVWHRENVAVPCTASDPGGPGLKDPRDASFSLETNVGAGGQNADATTGSREVCDTQGECATATPIGGFKIDREPPSIAVSSPVDGEVIEQGTSVEALYECSDSGAGLASCEGSRAKHQDLETAEPGSYALSIASRDEVGNTASQTVHYTVVAPAECPLGGQLCQDGLGDTPATLTGFSISPTEVNTETGARSVQVSVTAGDAVSGVAAIQVSLSDGKRWFSAPATLNSGESEFGGTWTATVELPRGAPKGTYALTVGTLDYSGNGRTYSHSELEALGALAAVTQEGAGSETPPELSDITIEPGSLSTCAAPESVLVTTKVSDASRVVGVEALLRGPERDAARHTRSSTGRKHSVAGSHSTPARREGRPMAALATRRR